MATQPVEQLAQDLHYVREAVATSRTVQYQFIAIPVLWAGVIAVGFALNDFCQTATVGLYWAIVAPVVGMLSGWLGMHAERSAGVQSDRMHRGRQALHWLTILAGFIAVIVITTAHGLDGRLAGQLMTLIFGVVYFLGGLHLDGRFLCPGMAAIAGSAAIDHLGPFSWTIVGVVIAVALVASALWTKGSHAHTSTQV
jgi:hypothetical protein